MSHGPLRRTANTLHVAMPASAADGSHSDTLSFETLSLSSSSRKPALKIAVGGCEAALLHLG